jgi:hypothetical protein
VVVARGGIDDIETLQRNVQVLGRVHREGAHAAHPQAQHRLHPAGESMAALRWKKALYLALSIFASPAVTMSMAPSRCGRKGFWRLGGLAAHAAGGQLDRGAAVRKGHDAVESPRSERLGGDGFKRHEGHSSFLCRLPSIILKNRPEKQTGTGC